MTDQHVARDSRPTTEQIASAGATNIDAPEAPFDAATWGTVHVPLIPVYGPPVAA